MKNGVFWVVTPCGSCKYNTLVFLRSVCRLLVAACVVPSSPIFITLMKEAPGSSEMSVLTRTTRRDNPEDTILHKLRVFVNRLLRRIFGPKRDGMTGEWEISITRSCMIYTLCQL
jgi:hypothetical protein